MKAITMTDFESGAALSELPDPEPAPNEIRVRVHASSINPFDFFVANGLAKGMLEYEFPVTVGADFAGVVDKVGPEVSRYSVGDEVFGFVFTPPTLHLGTWAEYVVLPENMFVAAKPKSVSMLEAGALGIAARRTPRILRRRAGGRGGALRPHPEGSSSRLWRSGRLPTVRRP